MCMRGNRRTKNTFAAIESRSLTEFYAWRVRAANPRFLPTTSRSLGGKPPHHRVRPLPRAFYPLSSSLARARIRELRVGCARARAREAAFLSLPRSVIPPPRNRPTYVIVVVVVSVILVVDRKARLPLWSNAKITMKARTTPRVFSFLLLLLVDPNDVKKEKSL